MVNNKKGGNSGIGGHDFFERIGDDTELLSDQDQNTWAVFFSDISTILLIFFVLLLSFSVINPNKYEVVRKTIKGEITERTSIDELFAQLSEKVEKIGVAEYVDISREDLGLNIEIKNKIMFGSGTSSLTIRNRNIITSLVVELANLPKEFKFFIEGHTDDVPINDRRFPSNWHLSAARALTVLDLFRQIDIADERLRVEGFADTAPLKEYPLRDKRGNPIPKNREKN